MYLIYIYKFITMYTKKVYFLIETKKRELNSQIVLAKELVGKNIECYIISKKQFLSKQDIIKPGVVLLKSIGSRNIKLIKSLKKLGHKLVCLDSEGLSILNKKQITERVYEKNLKELEYFFCWGNYSLKIISNFFPKYKNKLITTGNPKFDIIKDFKKNKLFNKEVQEIKKKYGNFILFLTMFTVVNPLKRYGFANKKQSLKTIGFKNNRDLINLGKKFFNFQKNNLDFFINSIKNTSKKFPNKLLIIRPHPTENVDFWKNKFKNFNNINVVYDSKDTISWLISSEKNFSINCTTSLESYFLNKIGINLVKFDDKNVEYEWIVKTSKKLGSLKKVEDIIKKKKLYIKPNVKLSNYLYNFKTSSNSARKISYCINKISFLSLENKKKIFRYYRSKIYKFLKKNKILDEENIYKQKIDSIERKEIKEKLETTGERKNLIIEEFYPDFIKIYKK